MEMHAVREGPGAGTLPLLSHPGWAREYPWLVQGITHARGGGEDFDLRLFGDTAAPLERWLRLLASSGCHEVAHGRQVHGARIRTHGHPGGGVRVLPDTDGHATGAPGVLLTVSVADCVPVSIVDPVRRVVMLLHAGWRGVAARILERGMALLADRFAARPPGLAVHLGPAICGDCYEVGPEVHRALGLDDPGRPHPVDLRRVLGERALAAGVPPEGLTVSSFCTRCVDSPFYSHRGGDTGRQVAILGMRS